MRVILEQGDKPELRDLVYSLRKCGIDFVIIEDQTKQRRCLLSDDEIREGILEVIPCFSVGSQWVAVYRVLVDYYGFPEEVSAFCNRIDKMMRGKDLLFPIKYQSVQKPLASNRILQKPYRLWKVYNAPNGDRFFRRQKMIVERLLKALKVS